MGCGASAHKEVAPAPAPNATPKAQKSETQQQTSSPPTTAPAPAPASSPAPAPAPASTSAEPQTENKPETAPAAVPAKSSAEEQAPAKQQEETGVKQQEDAATGISLVVAGAPACGKGTYCNYIVKEFGLVHVSTGDVLREELRNKTEKGVQIQKLMDENKEMGDDLLVDVVSVKLQDPEVKKRGWLLDGFPRTAAQAQKLRDAGVQPQQFVLLTVPDEELIDRVSNRRLDPVNGTIYHLTTNPPPDDETVKSRLIQRADDSAEKVKERLQLFHKSVEAVKPFFDTSVELQVSQDQAVMEMDIKKLLKR